MRDVLAGRVDQDDRPRSTRAARALIVVSIVGANVIGAAVVTLLLTAVLPLPTGAAQFGGLAGAGGAGALAYTLVAVVAGVVLGLRQARPVLAFFLSGERPGERDRRAVLRLPLALLRVQALLWGLAVVVFGLAGLRVSGLYGFEVAVTVLLGGIPTCSLAYLATQRLLRGGIAIVLAAAPPRRREVPGVTARSLLAWALSAVPIGGVIALAGFAPFTDTDRDTLARAVAVLAVVSVLVGLLASVEVARSVAEPLQLLRDAVEDVEDGHFDVSVPVFDASEVGYATSSFNRMAAGLRERERLRDLFGRQVGGDVARQALEEGVTLGGEEREVAALFVDVVGSTTFAAERRPSEVVGALNEFFEAVVGATQDHGGLVNKFIGDAALCVFGAPLAHDDPAGAALSAARDMRERLRGATLDAGIGVAFGTVVAGNVGTPERYEYTVVGDPVNEAARITDLAKKRDGRVLASHDTVAAARSGADGWHDVDEATLRGRTRPTVLAAPD